MQWIGLGSLKQTRKKKKKKGKGKKKMRKKYNMHMYPKNERIYLNGRVSGVRENVFLIFFGICSDNRGVEGGKQ